MKKVIKLLAVSILTVSAQQSQAVTIQLDYSYDTNNFFSDQARRNVLDTAANYFSTRINDSLTAITPSGNNQFTASFAHPGNNTTASISNYSVAADTLVVFAGGRDLPGSTIGQGGSGGYGVSGTSAFVNNVASRGQGNTEGINANDFGPWGGSITFDNQTTWYFDADVSTNESFTGNDFYSVALHELAHLLGFGASDSWDNLASTGSFTGVASTAVNGGVVPLQASGNPVRYPHWANGTFSLVDAVSQEAAMDPSIQTGTRKYFTDLDIAGLKDVGWEITEVSAVPVPATVYFFGSALFGLGAFRKKAR